MLNITGVMVLPAYVFSMTYLWKICEDNKYPGNAATTRAAALICSILAVIFGLWLIYAAGLNYLFMATIIVACGVPFYVWARKQNAPDEPVFATYEKVILVLLILAALFAIYMMARGFFKPDCPRKPGRKKNENTFGVFSCRRNINDMESTGKRH